MVTPRNRAQEKTVSMSRQERINISDRTRAGLQRAVKAGKVLGRREVSVDVVRARKMQREGLGLRPIAKKLRISVNTLQLRK
jgi:DNA invertase Pin-like site-specific DNA recombinase